MYDDGHETDRREQGQADVHRRQQTDDVDERGDVDDQEHEAESDEATDHGDVAVRPRQELTGLPPVVEGKVEPLDVRVEVVAHDRFHLGRGVGQHQPAHEREPAVDHADGDEQQHERLDAGPVAVGQRPVDHALGDHRQIRRDDGPGRARRGS